LQTLRATRGLTLSLSNLAVIVEVPAVAALVGNAP
jgi:hypothetical protein